MGGNLVAEEDVMTKLPAIKTRFHFEGLSSALKCILSHKFCDSEWSKLEKLFATSWSEVSPFVTSCLSYSSDLSELRNCSESLATL